MHCPYAGPPCGGQAEGIHTTGVIWRFGFDVLELRKLSTSCQKQSNDDASWGVLYTALIGFGHFCVRNHEGDLYSHIGVGL